MMICTRSLRRSYMFQHGCPESRVQFAGIYPSDEFSWTQQRTTTRWFLFVPFLVSVIRRCHLRIFLMCSESTTRHGTRMMASSYGNIFRVTGPLCGGIHRSQFPHNGQWRETLVFSFICAWINAWVNKRWAGDLRRYRAHHDVIVLRMVAPAMATRWDGLMIGRGFAEQEHKTPQILDMNS